MVSPCMYTLMYTPLMYTPLMYTPLMYTPFRDEGVPPTGAPAA
eukprot:gene45691-67120_t